MKLHLVALGLFVALLGSSAAKAQVTVDAAKITCREFAYGSIGRPRSVAYWLSGYLNGKRDNTVIDVPGMERNVRRLELYCLKHHGTLVLDAAKEVFGAGK